ncbi:uncharacterized protein AFUA_2G08100 [Aspergillus fumigatus Af293]|uniref:Uncharacterized protein n=2 Tax=Aspergillus fumigatus TaxID=746128 RepID=Q4X208_ASPFU|nr:hypothetical protein AFUA_2G08100 [Aspergillus fumigatus Af293]EAL93107.1 hypothetical protein AFUA_2G08100 [Aspergillus fumigatus Af293]EDP54355.1 hypothetical protein AFUB_024119 [Aspergillus fumigatus A1163]
MINQAGRETRLVDDLGCRASSQVTVSQGAQGEGYHSFFGSKPWIFMQSEMPIYQDTEYFVAGPSR